MVKERKHGNREAKKPKKVKLPDTAANPFGSKGVAAQMAPTKKK